MMPGKLEPLLQRELLPDTLRVRAQLVDDNRGIGPQVPQPRAVLLHERKQSLQTQLSQVHTQRRKMGIFDAPKVRMRQPAIARHRMHHALPAKRAQGDDRINRGQTGAEQHDGAARGREAVLPGEPGIANPRRMFVQRLRTRKFRRRFIPRRQHDVLRLHPAATRQMNHSTAVLRPHIQRLALNKACPHKRGLSRALQILLHQAAQVVAIDHARNEPLAQFDVRHRVVFRARAQPLEEVVRLVGKGGHVARRHIEQVLHAPGAVSHAACGGAAMVDERNKERTQTEPCQVHSRHHTAVAAANDGDACDRGRDAHFLIRRRLVLP